ncbi:RusA-like resolvase [Arthrobacter phage TaeYoung]|uniref:RusA-like resolvase n=1 Tax=Arthrobacter phage TaeYoung TaxID=1772318 RepID=A0A0U4KB50_9CAUD|nr:RusA-like resolvase [Arthrobacter phage TaeYoung]
MNNKTTQQNNTQTKQQKQRRARAVPPTTRSRVSSKVTTAKTGSKLSERHTALRPVEPIPTDLWPDPHALELHATIELDIRALDWLKTRISANDRLEKYAKNTRTQIWRNLAAGAALRAGVEPLTWARIVYWVRWPDNRKRETSNLQPTAKAIVDGLVDAGVLLDDRDEIVDGPDARRIYPNGPHRVIIQLWRKA